MRRIVLDSNILIGIYNATIDYSELESVEEIFVSSMTVMEIFALAGMSKKTNRAKDTLKPTCSKFESAVPPPDFRQQ